MKRAELRGDRLKVSFQVSRVEFGRVLTLIKSIKGRQFDPLEKCWWIPYNSTSVEFLKLEGFEIVGVDVVLPKREEIQAPIDMSKVPKELRAYQVMALKFIEATQGRAILSLAARLGKTVVSLSYYLLHKDISPVLIICPAIAKLVWQRELKKWLNTEGVIVNGLTPYLLPDNMFYIINYDILYSWKEYLSTMGIRYIILDELHRISTPHKKERNDLGEMIKVPVQCTDAFLQLAKRTPHIVMLSGTPANSNVLQLQVPLSVLSPQEFGDRWKFSFRYCDPKKTRWGWDFSGLSNGEELYNKLSKYMFRRTKEDVFTELPSEEYVFLPMEVDRALYEKEMQEFKEWFRKHSDAPDEVVEEKLSKFESLSYSKKRGQIIEWIKDFLEENDKLVIFTWGRAVSEDLHNVFKKRSVMIYGGTPADKRQKYIDAFNTDSKVNLFIGNIKAVKESISLYAADCVLYAELPSVPSDLEQSKSRIWLPEKKEGKLCYYFPVCEGTVDQKRIEILQERANNLSKVLDGKSVNVYGKALTDLIEE